jgi:tetratricopeptide (TPR) repeat protein
MRMISRRGISSIVAYLITLVILLMIGCSGPDWFVGTGGKYNEARIELTRGPNANIDKAIENLEGIVQENPTYLDSLTLLGRAYYKKRRYYDAHLILQRAVAVNKEDEIAWLVFGLAQIRLGEAEKGLESIKGGITLLSKAMGDDYRGFSAWDQRKTVRTSLRRSAVQAVKGLEDTDTLVNTIEQLLTRIDEEEWAQRRGKMVDRQTQSG